MILAYYLVSSLAYTIVSILAYNIIKSIKRIYSLLLK